MLIKFSRQQESEAHQTSWKLTPAMLIDPEAIWLSLQ